MGKENLYRVLRGSHQIGGSVVEITSKKGGRIWIDFGSELSVDEELSTDSELIARMQDKKTRPDAIFFTHIHGDHIGLLPYVEEGVKIFIGKTGKKMLDNIHNTLLASNNLKEDERKRIKTMADLLNNQEITTFYEETPQECRFKDITYTAVRVDHSVYDSYMLRFKVDGKVIVHTGDFRAHGRLGEDLVDKMKAAFIDNENGIDILFIEGTMMSRVDKKVLKEEEMQRLATDILKVKDNKYAFLLCSSLNMESLVSFYKAAMNNGKDFYCNSYVKKQLDIYTDIEDGRFDFSKAKLIKDAPVYDAEENNSKGFVMLVGKSDYYRNIISKYKDAWGEDKFILFYSMWNGYLEAGKDYSDQKLIDFISDWDDSKVEKLHTSGHASKKAIESVIAALHPNEAIVPIHTENPDAFFDLNVANYTKDEIKRIVKKGKDVLGDYYKELIYKNEIILRYSRAISCKWDNEKNPTKLCIKVNKPLSNMQTDEATFEGIICVLWSRYPNMKVELSFNNKYEKEILWNEKFRLPTYEDKKGSRRVAPHILHYMRFLYRVMKFEECFGEEYKFTIADDNKEIIEEFKKIFYNNKNNFFVTKPGTKKSGVSRSNELAENHLEKWFVMNSREESDANVVRKALGLDNNIELYDQMPCRLFVDRVSEETKIFSSGAIDLWGIGNNGELYVFELKKKGFEPLGIISELFFYAMLSIDMRHAKTDEKQTQDSYRGFEKFINSKKNMPVHAYFLTHSLHSIIDINKVLKVLNSVQKQSNVIFGNIHYNQDEIVPEEKTDEFLTYLRSKWEQFNYE